MESLYIGSDHIANLFIQRETIYEYVGSINSKKGFMKLDLWDKDLLIIIDRTIFYVR
jgi:hypothetical protein